MYQRIKLFLSADLVKVPVLNGIATSIRMITSLISVKIVANLIGPSGIALVGQLNNFAQIMMNLSNGGLIAGIIKYISEHKEDEEKCKSYISTGIRITVGLSVLLSIVLIIFSGKLSEMVFQSREYRSIDPWPAERTKRSRFGQLGSDESNRRWRVHRT